MDLFVTFESLEAEHIGQRSVEIGPDATITLDVDGVEMASHRFGALGSITLTPNRTISHGIAAYLIIRSRNQDNEISMEERLQRVKDQNAIQVASVPASFSVPVLAVHSTNSLPETVLVDCIDAHGESFQSQMTLPPGMTFLVNACIGHRSEGRTYEDILQGNGGETKGPMKIQVKSDQGPGGVVVWGFASTRETTLSPSQTRGIEFEGRNKLTDSEK
jgi:hypothetical protein